MTESGLKRKLSISLDLEVVELLDDYAKTFGTTRSGALNSILLMARPSLLKVSDEYQRFINEVDKTMPISQDQLDLFSGRVFRRIFGE